MLEEPKKMIEIQVTSHFVFHPEMYSSEELEIMNRTVDLFCRMKSTVQSEIMATVMYAYDKLSTLQNNMSEQDIFQFVLGWKKNWLNSKETEIKETIRSLLLLGWIFPEVSFSLGKSDVF